MFNLEERRRKGASLLIQLCYVRRHIQNIISHLDVSHHFPRLLQESLQVALPTAKGDESLDVLLNVSDAFRKV